MEISQKIRGVRQANANSTPTTISASEISFENTKIQFVYA